MLERQGGVCAFPGCTSTGPFIAEHSVPVALGNEEKPDCLLCRAHAYLKTANEDMPRISKARRQAGETGQQARRKKRKSEGKAFFPKRKFPRRPKKNGNKQ